MLMATRFSQSSTTNTAGDCSSNEQEASIDYLWLATPMRVGASAGSSENSKEGAVFNPVTVRQRLEYIRLWVMWTILKIKKIVRETSVTVGPRPSALPPPPSPSNLTQPLQPYVSEHLLT